VRRTAHYWVARNLVLVCGARSVQWNGRGARRINGLQNIVRGARSGEGGLGRQECADSGIICFAKPLEDDPQHGDAAPVLFRLGQHTGEGWPTIVAMPSSRLKSGINHSLFGGGASSFGIASPQSRRRRSALRESGRGATTESSQRDQRACAGLRTRAAGNRPERPSQNDVPVTIYPADRALAKPFWPSA
jgi:hypothetical protein